MWMTYKVHSMGQRVEVLQEMYIKYEIIHPCSQQDCMVGEGVAAYETKCENHLAEVKRKHKLA